MTVRSPGGRMGAVLAVLQERGATVTSHKMIARRVGCSLDQVQWTVGSLRKAGWPVHHAGRSRYVYDPTRLLVKKFERRPAPALAAVTPIGQARPVNYAATAATVDYERLLVELIRAAHWAFEQGYHRGEA